MIESNLLHHRSNSRRVISWSMLCSNLFLPFYYIYGYNSEKCKHILVYLIWLCSLSFSGIFLTNGYHLIVMWPKRSTLYLSKKWQVLYDCQVWEFFSKLSHLYDCFSEKGWLFEAPLGVLDNVGIKKIKLGIRKQKLF